MKLHLHFCCVNVTGGNTGTVVRVSGIHTAVASWAGPRGAFRRGCSARRQPGSFFSVEAVLAVGKAVWNTIVLSNLSGPAEPLNRPVFSQPRCRGTQVSPADSFLWATPSELSEKKKKKKVSSFILCFSLFFFFFSPLQLFLFCCCFDPKWFCGCLQAGTKCCRLKSQLWHSCG